MGNLIMAPRRREKCEHPWTHQPHLLVYGIKTIEDVWHKMVWDISQVEQVIFSKPVDIVSLAFALPNVCLSAMALRDWFKAEVKACAGRHDALELVRNRVRWSQLAEDVANTFKHRSYHSNQFKSGLVEMRVSLPSQLAEQRVKMDDWDAAIFALKHGDVATWAVVFRDHDTGEEIDAMQVLWAWEKDWHDLLSDMEMLGD